MYNAFDMAFTSNFDSLRRKKAHREDRDISLRKVAEETGLALATVHKAAGAGIIRLNLATLGKLCKYFKVKSIAELVEYAPDPDPEPTPRPGNG